MSTNNTSVYYGCQIQELSTQENLREKTDILQMYKKEIIYMIFKRVKQTLFSLSGPSISTAVAST